MLKRIFLSFQKLYGTINSTSAWDLQILVSRLLTRTSEYLIDREVCFHFSPLAQIYGI